MKRALTNQRDQPVELHLPGGVVVLGPRQTLELDEDVAVSPQLAVLERRRHVVVQRLEDEPTPTASAAGKTKDDARRKATRGA
jgi:hypothetical protein